MDPDEAYEDYVKFCKENDFDIASKPQFFEFMGITEEEDVSND